MKGSRFTELPMCYADSSMSCAAAPRAAATPPPMPPAPPPPLCPAASHRAACFRYCIALICPVMGALLAAAKAEGVESTDKEELCQHPKVVAAVFADVTAVCKAARLQRFECPQKVILVDELWTPDNDMLTAVQKLKRKPIEQKHKAEIDSVYI